MKQKFVFQQGSSLKLCTGILVRITKRFIVTIEELIS
jgi:hypothetical protein